MPEFELIRDTKNTIWYREHFTVEAETKEEAVKKLSEDKTVDSYHGEYIFDTCEDMTVEENDGYCTMEIFENTKDDPLWKNGK